MKKIAYISIILVISFGVNATLYAQTFGVEQFYNQYTSYPIWNMMPQVDYLQSYTQGLQNSRNLSSTYIPYNLNFNTSSGWLNHPPISVYSPTSPIVLKAGQSSSSIFRFIDPDADRLYTSSSFGATGSYGNGYLNWSFSPTFPGRYLLDTTVYDERGGFAIMRSVVDVKPWWSF